MNLWSFARADLGLGEAEFWSSTLRMLYWLGRRLCERRHREEYLFAQLCAIGINYSMQAPRKPARVEDFTWTRVPGRRHRAATQSDATPEQIAANCRQVMLGYMGSRM